MLHIKKKRGKCNARDCPPFLKAQLEGDEPVSSSRTLALSKCNDPLWLWLYEIDLRGNDILMQNMRPNKWTELVFGNMDYLVTNRQLQYVETNSKSSTNMKSKIEVILQGTNQTSILFSRIVYGYSMWFL